MEFKSKPECGAVNQMEMLKRIERFEVVSGELWNLISMN
jgi:hypothetical protein